MDIRRVVQSQYLAALKMLKEAIVKCPAAMWDAPRDKDRFWYVAHHAVYWAHRFLRAGSADFETWRGHRRPDGSAPISKLELLEYLAHVERQVRERAAGTDFEAAPGSRGFRVDRLELAIVGIRHIQQHTGELYERLGSRAGVLLHWTEQIHRKGT